MRILEINSLVSGSTGSVMLMIAQRARALGHVVLTATPKSHTNTRKALENHLNFGHIILRNISAKLAFLTGSSGCFNYIDTLLFLRKIDKFKPDVIHLHNLHSEYINLPLLFRYIKRNNIQTVWTLHDCWSFTGGCAHFTLEQCDKWKTGCYDCRIYRNYPASYFDNTRKMWRLKKEWFTNVPSLTIVTPSKWLGNLVKQSYLKEYPVKVIHNGINLEMFRPNHSSFRQDYGLEGKKIVLGVAYGWGVKKGLDVMLRLSEKLPDTYRIVLVGTNDEVDKQLAPNIISIHRTENQRELAEIYTVADVFVNPTREDNFPTVNIESLACGAPVVTFKTGGSPECIDETCGVVVPVDNVEEMYNSIIRICEECLFHSDNCVKRAELFDQNKVYKNYTDLFSELAVSMK